MNNLNKSDIENLNKKDEKVSVEIETKKNKPIKNTNKIDVNQNKPSLGKNKIHIDKNFKNETIKDKNTNKYSKTIGIHGLSNTKGNNDIDNGLEDKYKNKIFYNLLNRLTYFCKNVKKNIIFWTSFIVSILVLSILYGNQSSAVKNILSGFISIILAMLIGYVVHLISHLMDYEKLYDDFIDSNKIFNMIPESIHKFMKLIIRYTFNFHDVIHHNSNINKKWYNILIEGIQNMIMEGVGLIIFSLFTNFGLKLGAEMYKLNHSTILLWSLLYTTVHLINYRIVHPNSHINHHKDYYKNLSLTDLFDILFGTKYDKNDIQDLKHFTINVLIIFILIIFLKSNNIDNKFLNLIKDILS